jgi:hypothetical protein
MTPDRQNITDDHQRLIRLCADLRTEHDDHPTVYDADRRIKAILLECAESLESCAKIAKQNWHFFEVCADEKNQLLCEADEWKGIANELADHVKGDCPDEVETLQRLWQVRAGNTRSWINAMDINRPGGWYWIRCGIDDETCPSAVFIYMDEDGDSAPDFRVIWNGENEKTAKRLKHYVDRDWLFMEIPRPGVSSSVKRKSNSNSGTNCPPVETQLEQIRAAVERMIGTTNLPLSAARVRVATIEEVLDILDNIETPKQ